MNGEAASDAKIAEVVQADTRALLKRVLIPIESPSGLSRTTDGRQYVRLMTGELRRTIGKARGKSIRRQWKVERQRIAQVRRHFNGE